MSLERKRLMKKKKPAFTRQETHKKLRIRNKPQWRKPKGLQSKMRLSKAGKKPTVKPGYRTPVAYRGMNLKGQKLIPIQNIADLEKLDKESLGIVNSSVGKRKLLLIIEAAAKKNVLLSLGSKKVESITKELEERKEKRKKLHQRRSKKIVKEEKKKEEKVAEKKEEKTEKSTDKKETKKENIIDDKKEKARLEEEKKLIKKGAQE